MKLYTGFVKISIFTEEPRRISKILMYNEGAPPSRDILLFNPNRSMTGLDQLVYEVLYPEPIQVYSWTYVPSVHKIESGEFWWFVYTIWFDKNTKIGRLGL